MRWRPLWRAKTTITFVCVSRLAGSIIFAGPFITSTLYKKNGIHFRPVSGRGKNHYKPTIPDPTSSITSEPESETNANRNSSTKSETNANWYSGTKLKRNWAGTRAWFLNNHESELQHQPELKANQTLSMKMKRTSIGTWTRIELESELANQSECN